LCAALIEEQKGTKVVGMHVLL